MDLNSIQPNNSKAYRNNQLANGNDLEIKKIEKVTTGKVTRKAQPLGKRLSSLFLSEETGSIKEYLIYDLLIPAVKDTFVDTLESVIDLAFYGKVRGKRGGRSSARSSSSYFDYSSASNRRMTPRSRTTYSFDDIYLESAQEAEEVLNVLNDFIEQYGKVTVADYYEAVGVTGNGYTDRSYGWTDLRQAWVSRDGRNGYSINMPKCIDIR